MNFLSKNQKFFIHATLAIIFGVIGLLYGGAVFLFLAFATLISAFSGKTVGFIFGFLIYLTYLFLPMILTTFLLIWFGLGIFWASPYKHTHS